MTEYLWHHSGHPEVFRVLANGAAYRVDPAEWAWLHDHGVETVESSDDDRYRQMLARSAVPVVTVI